MDVLFESEHRAQRMLASVQEKLKQMAILAIVLLTVHERIKDGEHDLM